LISVIIPVLNEASTLGSFLAQPLFDTDHIEFIFVDGGSMDQTVDLIESDPRQSFKIIHSPAGRARQMNAGVNEASGDSLLFLHADTVLPDQALIRIEEALKVSSWGRFDVALDAPGISFKIISWFINQRSRLSGIATGDQAIFVQRPVFESIKGFPEQKLMEDIALSKLLKVLDRPVFLTLKVKTSARKWQQEGVIRTVLKMWYLRAAYALGVEPDQLWQSYYGARK